MDLNGKCVLLGVSGGIAAYKMANVASALRKLGADDSWTMAPELLSLSKITDQDVANLVAFLASDLAAFISGQYVSVSGGNVMPTI